MRERARGLTPPPERRGAKYESTVKQDEGTERKKKNYEVCDVSERVVEEMSERCWREV